MGGEPWCYTPDILASLTNEQIEKLYFAPRDDKGQLIVPDTLRIAAIKAENNPDEMPTREEFVADGVEAHPGVDVQYWHDMYDQMLKKVADGNS